MSLLKDRRTVKLIKYTTNDNNVVIDIKHVEIKFTDLKIDDVFILYQENERVVFTQHRHNVFKATSEPYLVKIPFGSTLHIDMEPWIPANIGTRL